jgi:outer membrane protein OmpA-like peptidoglycan-associated protein
MFLFLRWILAAILILVFVPGAVYAAPAVTVNEWALQNLGAPPNPPGLYSRAIAADKPVVPGARPLVNGPAMDLPNAPRQKPRSHWNQKSLLLADAKKPKSAKTIAAKKFKPKSANEKSFGFSLSSPALAGSSAKTVQNPGVAGIMPFSGPAMAVGPGLVTYRWADIDPRTRGMPVVVDRPANIGQVLDSVTFAKGDVDLDNQAKKSLQPLAQNLQANPMAVELRGYATPDPDSGDDAKRVALSRIINVRDFLIGQGIPGRQLGVKAVGQAQDGPAERVDIFVP